MLEARKKKKKYQNEHLGSFALEESQKYSRQLNTVIVLLHLILTVRAESRQTCPLQKSQGSLAVTPTVTLFGFVVWGMLFSES